MGRTHPVERDVRAVAPSLGFQPISRYETAACGGRFAFGKKILQICSILIAFVVAGLGPSHAGWASSARSGLKLEAGWNLVPNPQDDDGSLFRMYKALGLTLWRATVFDAPGEVTVPHAGASTELEAFDGQGGVWAFAPNPVELVQPENPTPSVHPAGWSVLRVAQDIQLTDPNIERVFHWDRVHQAYRPVGAGDGLRQGEGYWIELRQASVPFEVVDFLPPALVVYTPSSERSRRVRPWVAVGGEVFDDHLQGLYLNGVQIADVSTSFNEILALEPGANRFDLVATDAAGNQTSVSKTVVRDLPDSASNESSDDGTLVASSENPQEPKVGVLGDDDASPELLVHSPSAGLIYSNDRNWVVKAQAVDEDLLSVSINGVVVSTSNTPFSHAVRLAGERTVLTLVARDRAEHRTEKSFEIRYDDTPPVLSLGHAQAQTVYAPSYRLHGRVTDAHLESLQLVNFTTGEAYPQTLTEDGHFSHEVALAEGANSLTVVATDAAQNQSSRAVVLTYAPEWEDARPPRAPSRFSATSRGDVVVLSWAAPTRLQDGTAIPEGVDLRYSVTRDGAQVGQSADVVFHDVVPEMDRVYRYEVHAVLKTGTGPGLESPPSDTISLALAASGDEPLPGTFEAPSIVPDEGLLVALPKVVLSQHEARTLAHLAYVARAPQKGGTELRYRSSSKAARAQSFEAPRRIASLSSGWQITDLSMTALEEKLSIAWIQQRDLNGERQSEIWAAESENAGGHFRDPKRVRTNASYKRGLDVGYDHQGHHHLVWGEANKVYYVRDLGEDIENVFDVVVREKNDIVVSYRMLYKKACDQFEDPCGCFESAEEQYTYALEEDSDSGEQIGPYRYRLEEAWVYNPSLKIDAEKVSIVARQDRMWDNRPVRNPNWRGAYGPVVPPRPPSTEVEGAWCDEEGSRRSQMGFMHVWSYRSGRPAPYPLAHVTAEEHARRLAQEEDPAAAFAYYYGEGEQNFVSYDPRAAHDKDWYFYLHDGTWHEQDKIRVAQRPLASRAWSKTATTSVDVPVWPIDRGLLTWTHETLSVEEGWRRGSWKGDRYQNWRFSVVSSEVGSADNDGHVVRPQLVGNEEGLLVAVYEDGASDDPNQPGHNAIKISVSKDGGVLWSRPTVVGRGYMPDVSLLADGELAIVYYEALHSDDGFSRIQLARSHDLQHWRRSTLNGQAPRAIHWKTHGTSVDALVGVPSLAAHDDLIVASWVQQAKGALGSDTIVTTRASKDTEASHFDLSHNGDLTVGKSTRFTVTAVNKYDMRVNAEGAVRVAVGHGLVSSGASHAGSAVSGSSIGGSRASDSSSGASVSSSGGSVSSSGSSDFSSGSSDSSSGSSDSSSGGSGSSAGALSGSSGSHGGAGGLLAAQGSGPHGGPFGASAVPSHVHSAEGLPGLALASSQAVYLEGGEAQLWMVVDEKESTLWVQDLDGAQSATSKTLVAFGTDALGNYDKALRARDALLRFDQEKKWAYQVEYAPDYANPDVAADVARYLEPTEWADGHLQDARHLAGFERVWVYTQGIALAQFSLKGDAHSIEIAQGMARYLCDHARPGVFEGESIIRGWPFSWNTLDDTWEDARLVTGANSWAIHGLGTFVASEAHQQLGEADRLAIQSCYHRALRGLKEHRRPVRSPATGETVSLMTAGWTALGLQRASTPASLPRPFQEAENATWAYYSVLDAIGYDGFDETQPPYIKRWQGGHSIEPLELTSEGQLVLKRPVLAENIVTEHNLDVLSVLNHALLHHEKTGLTDVEELRAWRDELRAGIFEVLWDDRDWKEDLLGTLGSEGVSAERRAHIERVLQEDALGRVITGGELEGNAEPKTFAASPHVAIDNCSWLSLSVDFEELPEVYVDRLARCLEFTELHFAKDLRFGSQSYYGTHYFQNAFRDPYIDESELQESSFHLEATTGLILGLHRFAQAHPSHEKAGWFRARANLLWDGVQSFVTDHGFPYSSQRIQDLSTLLSSSTAVIWFIDVYQALGDHGDLDRPLKNYASHIDFNRLAAFMHEAYPALRAKEVQPPDGVNPSDTGLIRSMTEPTSGEPLTLVEDQALAVMAAVNEGDFDTAADWVQGLLDTQQISSRTQTEEGAAEDPDFSGFDFEFPSGVKTWSKTALNPTRNTGTQLLAYYALAWFIGRVEGDYPTIKAAAEEALENGLRTMFAKYYQHEDVNTSGLFLAGLARPGRVFRYAKVEDNVLAYFTLSEVASAMASGPDDLRDLVLEARSQLESRLPDLCWDPKMGGPRAHVQESASPQFESGDPTDDLGVVSLCALFSAHTGNTKVAWTLMDMLNAAHGTLDALEPSGVHFGDGAGTYLSSGLVDRAVAGIHEVGLPAVLIPSLPQARVIRLAIFYTPDVLPAAEEGASSDAGARLDEDTARGKLEDMLSEAIKRANKVLAQSEVPYVLEVHVSGPIALEPEIRNTSGLTDLKEFLSEADTGSIYLRHKTFRDLLRTERIDVVMIVDGSTASVFDANWSGVEGNLVWKPGSGSFAGGAYVPEDLSAVGLVSKEDLLARHLIVRSLGIQLGCKPTQRFQSWEPITGFVSRQLERFGLLLPVIDDLFEDDCRDKMMTGLAGLTTIDGRMRYAQPVSPLVLAVDGRYEDFVVRGPPFTALEKTYTLTNNSDKPIEWAAGVYDYQNRRRDAAFLSLSETSGRLEPRASTRITVRLDETRISAWGSREKPYFGEVSAVVIEDGKEIVETYQGFDVVVYVEGPSAPSPQETVHTPETSGLSFVSLDAPTSHAAFSSGSDSSVADIHKTRLLVASGTAGSSAPSDKTEIDILVLYTPSTLPSFEDEVTNGDPEAEAAFIQKKQAARNELYALLQSARSETNKILAESGLPYVLHATLMKVDFGDQKPELGTIAKMKQFLAETHGDLLRSRHVDAVMVVDGSMVSVLDADWATDGAAAMWMPGNGAFAAGDFYSPEDRDVLGLVSKKDLVARHLVLRSLGIQLGCEPKKRPSESSGGLPSTLLMKELLKLGEAVGAVVPTVDDFFKPGCREKMASGLAHLAKVDGRMESIRASRTLELSVNERYENFAVYGPPFTSLEKTYTLTNNSDQPVQWAAGVYDYQSRGSEDAFLSLSERSGQLHAGASTDITVRLDEAHLNAWLPRDDPYYGEVSVVVVEDGKERVETYEGFDVMVHVERQSVPVQETIYTPGSSGLSNVSFEFPKSNELLMKKRALRSHSSGLLGQGRWAQRIGEALARRSSSFVDPRQEDLAVLALDAMREASLASPLSVSGLAAALLLHRPDGFLGAEVGPLLGMPSAHDDTGYGRITDGFQSALDEPRVPLEARLSEMHQDVLRALLISPYRPDRFDALFGRLTMLRFALGEAQSQTPLRAWPVGLNRVYSDVVHETDAALQDLCGDHVSTSPLGPHAQSFSAFFGLACDEASHLYAQLRTARFGDHAQDLERIVVQPGLGEWIVLLRSLALDSRGSAPGHVKRASGSGCLTCVQGLAPLALSPDLSMAQVQSALQEALNESLTRALQRDPNGPLLLSGVDPVSAFHPESPDYWTLRAIIFRLAAGRNAVHFGRLNFVNHIDYPRTAEAAQNVRALRRMLNHGYAGSLGDSALSPFGLPQIQTMLKTGIVHASTFDLLVRAQALSDEARAQRASEFAFFPELSPAAEADASQLSGPATMPWANNQAQVALALAPVGWTHSGQAPASYLPAGLVEVTELGPGSGTHGQDEIIDLGFDVNTKYVAEEAMILCCPPSDRECMKKIDEHEYEPIHEKPFPLDTRTLKPREVSLGKWKVSFRRSDFISGQILYHWLQNPGSAVEVWCRPKVKTTNREKPDKLVDEAWEFAIEEDTPTYFLAPETTQILWGPPSVPAEIMDETDKAVRLRVSIADIALFFGMMADLDEGDLRSVKVRVRSTGLLGNTNVVVALKADGQQETEIVLDRQMNKHTEYEVTFESDDLEGRNNHQRDFQGDYRFKFKVPSAEEFTIEKWDARGGSPEKITLFGFEVPTAAAEELSGAKSPKKSIPDWIKTNVKLWADNKIDDQTFIHGLEFLIQEDIISVDQVEPQGDGPSGDGIPEWIKTNVKLWADNKIDDQTFIHGLEFLIQERIIRLDIDPEQELEEAGKRLQSLYVDAGIELGLVVLVVDSTGDSKADYTLTVTVPLSGAVGWRLNKYDENGPDVPTDQAIAARTISEHIGDVSAILPETHEKSALEVVRSGLEFLVTEKSSDGSLQWALQRFRPGVGHFSAHVSELEWQFSQVQETLGPLIEEILQNPTLDSQDFVHIEGIYKNFLANIELASELRHQKPRRWDLLQLLWVWLSHDVSQLAKVAQVAFDAAEQQGLR